MLTGTAGPLQSLQAPQSLGNGAPRHATTRPHAVWDAAFYWRVSNAGEIIVLLAIICFRGLWASVSFHGGKENKRLATSYFHCVAP